MSHSIDSIVPGAEAASCAGDCVLADAAGRAESLHLAGDRLRLDRRGFLTQAMMVAAAAALAACGTAGGFDTIVGPTNVGATVKLSDYPALANVGGIALTTINGAQLALVRTSASTFIALSRSCPHQGSTVGTNGSGGFTCPRHGARFDSHGSWVGGQPTNNMRSYAVTYDETAGTLAIG